MIFGIRYKVTSLGVSPNHAVNRSIKVNGATHTILVYSIKLLQVLKGQRLKLRSNRLYRRISRRSLAARADSEAVAALIGYRYVLVDGCNGTAHDTMKIQPTTNRHLIFSATTW